MSPCRAGNVAGGGWTTSATSSRFNSLLEAHSMQVIGQQRPLTHRCWWRLPRSVAGSDGHHDAGEWTARNHAAHPRIRSFRMLPIIALTAKAMKAIARRPEAAPRTTCRSPSTPTSCSHGANVAAPLNPSHRARQHPAGDDQRTPSVLRNHPDDLARTWCAPARVLRRWTC